MSADRAMQIFGGMFGQAERDGKVLHDAISVTPTVEIGRSDVNLVGRTRPGTKRTRDTGSGSMSVQKRDTSWELALWKHASRTPDERRLLRGSPDATFPAFDIVLRTDDPDALGVEAWRLKGVSYWQYMPGAFDIQDETTSREYPITWESEEPVEAFVAEQDSAGSWIAKIIYAQGAATGN